MPTKISTDTTATPVSRAELRPYFAQLLVERADALAQYERVSALAVAMGEGDRICKRPLKSLSATEISHMAEQLGIALDKVAAGVAGYVRQPVTA